MFACAGTVTADARSHAKTPSTLGIEGRKAPTVSSDPERTPARSTASPPRHAEVSDMTIAKPASAAFMG
jgi:hypothetical protein